MHKCLLIHSQLCLHCCSLLNRTKWGVWGGFLRAVCSWFSLVPHYLYNHKAFDEDVSISGQGNGHSITLPLQTLLETRGVKSDSLPRPWKGAGHKLYLGLLNFITHCLLHLLNYISASHSGDLHLWNLELVQNSFCCHNTHRVEFFHPLQFTCLLIEMALQKVPHFPHTHKNGVNTNSWWESAK